MVTRTRSPLFPLVLAGSIFCGFILPCRLPGQQTDYLKRPDVSGAHGGNLVVAASADPSTLNRMLATTFPNIVILDRLAADLVHINRATLELEPALAVSWDKTADGRTWTLHLRRGLKFSDGSPFTADDVIFTFEALKDSRLKAILAGQLESEGAFPTFSKIDAHTIRIAYPKPVGLGLRALDSIPILPKARLEKAFREGTLATEWGPNTPPAEVVGLGPFRLRSYERGVQVVLERNPYYWKRDKSGQALPYLDSITFLIVPDGNTESLRFESGEIHIVNNLSPENYARLRRDSSGRISVRDVGPGMMMDFLWFNLNPVKITAGRPNVDPDKRAVFVKPEFRRAVSHAINREGLARSIYLGLGTPQYGPISSGNKPWFNPGMGRTTFDLKKARELLAAAGLRDTNGDGIVETAGGRPMEFTLLTARGNTARENMAQVIRNDLSQAGIRVDVQALPTNELITRALKTTEYEAILFGFTPTDVAPDLQTEVWYSSGGNHFWHPGQAQPATDWEGRMDALTTTLVRSLDPKERLRAFFGVQEIWARELPAIPTISPNVLVGWNSRVGNIRPSILPPQLLWNAEELTKK